MIVGREIRTMFESNRAMKLAIVVLTITMYLYSKIDGSLLPPIALSRMLRLCAVHLSTHRKESEKLIERGAR